MYYKKEELEIKNFKEMPIDESSFVCIVNAIKQNKDGTIEIDDSRCIRCGLCSQRCPIGAINFSNGRFVVNSGELDEKIYTEVDLEEEIDEKNIRLLDTASQDKVICEINEIDKFYQYLEKADINSDSANILIRNILIALSIPTAIHKKGDIYFRFDGIGDIKDKIGIIEIEFGHESLDSSRALLDDIAVMVSRYGSSFDKLVPVVVNKLYPNKRTDYWRVINDIKNVLNIKIQTLTIGVLLFYLWTNKSIDLYSCNYYMDVYKSDIMTQLSEDGIDYDGENAVTQPNK